MESTKSSRRSFLVIAPWLIAAIAVYFVFDDYQRRAAQEKIAQERAVEERAVAEIQKLGGFIWYEGPPDLRVTSVSFVATGEVVDGKTVINEPEVTDEGLVHLKALTALRSLNLNQTKITDSGLAHLRGFSSLEMLNIRNTQVTDEGALRIQDELPNCEIQR